MDNGTTSIDSLPISPQSQENIKLDIQTQPQQYNPKVDNPKQDPASMQRNLNQFVTGLQQASAAGMTALPARDIPQEQTHLTQDTQMQPNYIPAAPSGGDYILNHQTSEDIIRENARRQIKTDSLDVMYNEMQVPILIGVLYFLFQLPVVRKNMFKFIPSLFSKDGNPNLSGYVVNSIMFAGLYYCMTKSIHHFSI